MILVGEFGNNGLQQCAERPLPVVTRELLPYNHVQVVAYLYSPINVGLLLWQHCLQSRTHSHMFQSKRV